MRIYRDDGSVTPGAIAFAVALVAAVIVLVVYWATQARECEKRGGAYVRTLSGFECVERR